MNGCVHGADGRCPDCQIAELVTEVQGLTDTVTLLQGRLQTAHERIVELENEPKVRLTMDSKTVAQMLIAEFTKAGLDKLR